MANAKKKLLPKDFKEHLDKSKLKELIAVFNVCDVNARGGAGKQTALAFDNCPDKLARWLVENGADIQATDTWGNTPLHTRSRSKWGSIQILIDLGADINSTSSSIGSPLHAAVDSHNVENAKILIGKGAKINLLNKERLTPLELALRSCSNMNIKSIAPLAEIMLDFVKEIGIQFELHKSGFDKDTLKTDEIGLAKLYNLFQVPAVPKRVLHNGKDTIIVTSTKWQKQYEELWELLVPSSGSAKTVQGELIRICGRIADEIEGNGGVNWDRDYKKMANAFLQYLGSGKPVSASELKKMTSYVKSLNETSENTACMARLAVKWVLQNPIPVKLGQVDYKR